MEATRLETAELEAHRSGLPKAVPPLTSDRADEGVRGKTRTPSKPIKFLFSFKLMYLYRAY